MKSPRTIVLLDLDDTLFDHTYSSLAGLAALRLEFAECARIPLETLATVYARNLEEVHEMVLAGELSPEEARVVRFRRVQTDCGILSIDPRHLAATYRAAYQRSRQAVPGAPELLRALRGRAQMAIVTNNVLAEQVHKLAHLEMHGFIDALVVSEEVGAKKPDPYIFRTALARLGGAAENAVMLGDSWGADVIGARAAGIWPVWLNRSRRTCPGPSICTEIASLIPTESVVQMLLDR